MNNFFKFTLLMFLLSTVVKTAFAQGFEVPIEKGIITGDFAITFIDKNITIKPNQYFNLAELGFKANNYPPNENGVDSKEYRRTLNGQKKGAFRMYNLYKIKINRTTDTTSYFGTLCFWNTRKQSKDEAVCKYYQISIPESYFESARDGQVSKSYEWYPLRGFGIAVKEIDPGNHLLTWLIFLSDSKSSVWDKVE